MVAAPGRAVGSVMIQGVGLVRKNIANSFTVYREQESFWIALIVSIAIPFGSEPAKQSSVCAPDDG